MSESSYLKNLFYESGFNPENPLTKTVSLVIKGKTFFSIIPTTDSYGHSPEDILEGIKEVLPAIQMDLHLLLVLPIKGWRRKQLLHGIYINKKAGLVCRVMRSRFARCEAIQTQARVGNSLLKRQDQASASIGNDIRVGRYLQALLLHEGDSIVHALNKPAKNGEKHRIDRIDILEIVPAIAGAIDSYSGVGMVFYPYITDFSSGKIPSEYQIQRLRMELRKRGVDARDLYDKQARLVQRRDERGRPNTTLVVIDTEHYYLLTPK